MEILLNLSATNLKRNHGIADKKLSDCIKLLNKKHWLVRKPIRKDKHQWTFLMGSNDPRIKPYTAIRFHRLDSEEGQKIFNILNFTRGEQAEWDRHTELTPNTSSILATAPSGQKPLAGLETCVNPAGSTQ